MQTEKQKWIEDVLNSTDGMTGVSAPDMSTSVLSRINTFNTVPVIPMREGAFMWRMAASVAILLVLNAASIYTYHSHISKTHKEQQAQAAAVIFGMGQSAGSDPGTAIFGN
jgi:hypothetical protein